MRIELSVRVGRDGEPGAEPAEELAELADWLAQDDELRGVVTPAPLVPVAGELGASTDVLVAAVGSGGAVSVLAASLKGFLAQPRRSDVTIVVTGADGRRVAIDAKRVRDLDVEALVRQVCVAGESGVDGESSVAGESGVDGERDEGERSEAE